MFQDTTGRKEEEDGLRESEQRYQRISSITSDIPYSCRKSDDTDYSIDWMAGATDRVLGYSVDEIKALKCWRNLVVDEDLPVFDRHVTGLSPGMSASCELRLRHREGNIVWVSSFAQCLREPGPPDSLRIYGGLVNITERKRIEEALRESGELFRTLVHNAPDAIYVQTLNSFAYLNPMALKLFGAETPHQLLGQPVIDRFDPSCHEAVKERIRSTNEERRSVNMLEEICLRLDGSPFHVEVSAAPVKWGEHHGGLVFFRDITKRLELEQRLRHNQIMLARTEKIAQIGSWEWEVATDSVTWSDELFRIFQLDPAQGAPSFEEHPRIYTPDSMARLREAVGLAISDGIAYELEIQGIRADGEIRHLRARGFPERGPDGRVSHLFGSLNDITEEKRLEEDRLQMERKLLHAQKLESLAVMAGGIAHDFNNQLAVVLGNLELALTDQTLDPDTLLSIESAIRAARRSAALSRQMLVYTGRILYFPAELDLNEVLNRNLVLLKSTVSRHVNLTFDTNRALPIIKGEAELLRQLVVNILVNASEAIGDQAGDVILRTGFIDCDGAYLRRSLLEEKPEPGRFVFLEVTDTGCGMDVETMRRLFDPFFSTKFTGRGLGMAEVMGIVRGHRGAIIIDTAIGKGTTVRVLFPVRDN